MRIFKFWHIFKISVQVMKIRLNNGYFWLLYLFVGVLQAQLFAWNMNYIYWVYRLIFFNMSRAIRFSYFLMLKNFLFLQNSNSYYNMLKITEFLRFLNAFFNRFKKFSYLWNFHSHIRTHISYVHHCVCIGGREQSKAF